MLLQCAPQTTESWKTSTVHGQNLWKFISSHASFTNLWRWRLQLSTVQRTYACKRIEQIAEFVVPNIWRIVICPFILQLMGHDLRSPNWHTIRSWVSLASCCVPHCIAPSPPKKKNNKFLDPLLTDWSLQFMSAASCNNSEFPITVDYNRLESQRCCTPPGPRWPGSSHGLRLDSGFPEIETILLCTRKSNSHRANAIE